jgi:RNA polymerase-binding transcription factor DksA
MPAKKQERRRLTDIELKIIKKNLLEKKKQLWDEIDDGKYGRCRDCHRQIRPARLQVQPYAIRCRSCQEKLEKIKQV